MVHPRSERLVVVEHPDCFAGVADALRARGRITQQLPPKLLLVSLSDASVDTSTPCATVYDGPVPDVVVARLDTAARLFVEAWRSRAASATGDARVGDGLDWDAPGYQLPDGPR